MLVHLIADYGHGDLAFAEVVQRLKRLLPEAELVLTPVPPFATLAAGFCVAQLGLNDAPEGTVIYHNVAPREDNGEARQNNAGERLAYARLPGGVKVVGVNAGYAFSFLKNTAEELRYVAVAAEGSQFRSRDLFPPGVAAVARGEVDALAGEVSPADVPQVPEARVAYIDGFGNLKTTFRFEEVGREVGSSLTLRIGDTTQEASLSDGSFAVPKGALAFSPGSSGWRVGETQIRWMELFLRGGSAWDMFGRPPVGSIIEIG